MPITYGMKKPPEIVGDLLAEVKRLRAVAYKDPLTGLPNRRAYEEELERARGGGEPFSVIVVDLDGFKNVNDTLGHEAGDAVLVHAAKRLRAQVRRDDFVARLDGDEFVIIVRSASPVALSRRLRAPGLPAVGVSAGEGDTFAEADRQMYAAKRAAR